MNKKIMIQIYFLPIFIILSQAKDTFRQLLSRQVVRIPLNKSVIIDQFPGYGQVLATQLVYSYRKSFLDYPCVVHQQKIIFQTQQSITLIEEFTSLLFEQNFVNGSLKIKVPKLIATEHITDGIITVSNTGVISISKFANHVLSRIEQIKLDFNIQNLFYFQAQEIIYLQLENSIQAYQVHNSLYYMNHFQMQTEFKIVIPYVAYAQDKRYLYFACREKGFQIYEPQKDGSLHLIKDFPINAIDVKCKNATVYVAVPFDGIYILENKNLTRLLLVSNCVSFDIVQETIVVVSKNIYNHHKGDLYHLVNNTYILTDTWRLQNEVSSVQIAGDYAIFTLQNGLFFMRISVQNMHSTMNQFLPVHGIQKIRFLSNSSFLAITFHSLLQIDWNETSMSIECYSENTNHINNSPLLLKLFINSTECPSKKDVFQLCTSRKDYEIYFISSIITGKFRIIIIVMILSSVLMFLLTLLGIAAQFYNFLKEKKKFFLPQLKSSSQAIYKDESDMNNKDILSNRDIASNLPID